MNKKDEFKSFAKAHPELISYIKTGKMTWQKFYEIYDIYGDDETVWKEYLKTETSIPKESTVTKATSLAGLTGLAKKVDMNSVQKHINTAQKAINLFKEFGTKSAGNATNILNNLNKGPTMSRPLNKFFED